MPSRRDVLVGIASGAAGLAGGYGLNEFKEDPQPGVESRPGPFYPATSIHGISEDGWRLSAGTDLRFADSIEVATTYEESHEYNVPDEAFETVHASEGQTFAIVYAAGYPFDNGADPGAAPPLEKWRMDVWIATERYTARLLDHPEAEHYRISGLGPVTTYPKSIGSGGYLVFEVEKTRTGGSHSLLYGPPGDEFTLDYDGIDFLVEWLVDRSQDGEENDEVILDHD